MKKYSSTPIHAHEGDITVFIGASYRYVMMFIVFSGVTSALGERFGDVGVRLLGGEGTGEEVALPVPAPQLPQPL